jgi:hypothetical protein
MVSYVTGTCSSAEKRDFETHCLLCDECCSTLANILLLAYSPISEEEEKALVPLYIIGVEAARTTRRSAEAEVEVPRAA